MNKFNDSDLNLLYDEIEKRTGASQKGVFKKEVFALNILMRIKKIKCENLTHYLQIIKNNKSEEAKFLNLAKPNMLCEKLSKSK